MGKEHFHFPRCKRIITFIVAFCGAWLVDLCICVGIVGIPRDDCARVALCHSMIPVWWRRLHDNQRDYLLLRPMNTQDFLFDHLHNTVTLAPLLEQNK